MSSNGVTGIGGIILWLYEAYMYNILPMLREFVRILNLTVDQFLYEFQFGFIDDILAVLAAIFNVDDMTVLQLMISSSVSVFVVWTLFRYFWGTVDFSF